MVPLVSIGKEVGNDLIIYEAQQVPVQCEPSADFDRSPKTEVSFHHEMFEILRDLASRLENQRGGVGVVVEDPKLQVISVLNRLRVVIN